MLAMHSPCSSEHRPPSRRVVAAAIWRRFSENRSLAKRQHCSRWCSPVWIPFRVVALLLACAATDLFPSRTNMLVAQATTPAETDVDVGALDRRANAALRLLEASDSAAGEAELRDLAERYPSYAQAPFYLGLLSQTRSDPETAISFYAATLRADETHADAMNNIGAVLSALPPPDRTRVAEAFGLSQHAPEAFKIMALAGNSGSTGISIEAVDSAVEGLFRRTLEAESTHRWALNNLGLHLHWRSRNEEAVAVFHRALELYPRDAEIHYNMGVTLQTLGMAQEAVQSFTNVLSVHPQHVGASINLAALHHRYGDTRTAIELYRVAAEVVDPGDSDMIVMLRNNVGTALFQLGEHTLAKLEHQAVLAILEPRFEAFPRLQADEEKYDVYLDTLVNLHRARKASCDWRDWERHLFNLVSQVDTRQLKAGSPPSLLPFDTLLLPYPVNPAWRRRVAEACSNHRIYEHREGYNTHQQDTDASTDYGASVAQGDGGEPTKERSRRHDAENRDRRGLHIGFVGHDFAEHPTAHMMEGVFVWQKRLAKARDDKEGSEGAFETGRGNTPRKPRANDGSNYRASENCCRYAIYSYGGGRGDDDRSGSGGDNSTSSRTRQSLRSHASSFVDLYATGHGESAARIQADGVDILVDLQGHTLGGRSEIVAARPARLQVSYLVFPGTSGAPYVDYLLADRHVTPPEHAAHYSESLVLLPRTYQANLYEGLGPETVEAVRLAGAKDYERAELRRAHGLPGDLSRPVFANFNKIDKLDPESFKLWMQVLRRVPGSVLWLLEASAVDTEKEAIRQRLGEEAKSRGIDGRRIVWARRLPKREHLLRHAAADLFLDTLIYGAHSTATDALAGGLPFLTLAGGTFASRVGVSLLRNAGPKQGALLVAGQREYEDLAVKLVSTLAGRELLRELRASLTNRRRGRHLTYSRVVKGDRAVGAGEGAMADAEALLPLFDTEAITRDLNRAFMLMSDVDDLWRDSGSEARARGGARLPHIVLTGKKLADEGWDRLSGRDRQ